MIVLVLKENRGKANCTIRYFHLYSYSMSSESVGNLPAGYDTSWRLHNHHRIAVLVEFFFFIDEQVSLASRATVALVW